MSYMALKHLHLVTVGIGLLLLLLRGFWIATGSAMLQRRWVRIVPHINYLVLIVAGVWLALMLRLNPAQQPWLMAKIIGLIVLIILGASIIPRVRGLATRLVLWAVALGLFGYILGVTLTRNPMPWAG